MRQTPRRLKTSSVPPRAHHNKGLFRTQLAGPGQTLNEAFASLERGNIVDKVIHHRAREHIVAVNIRPKALLSLLGDDVSRVPEAIRPMIDQRASGDFPILQLSMTAEVFGIASKLLEDPCEGPMALVYREAIATELLCAAVGAVATLAGQPSEHYSEREIGCLHAARAMLMRQLSRPPTIRQVARAAGINETMLKRGFKAMFGETVFDFSVRCRMQHALALFRERGLNVAQVAEAVGYRHQTSFSTAFRRHFGTRPKDVRRSRRA